MSTRKYPYVLPLLLLLQAASAVEIPTASRADGRIQYASYAPGNVTRVNAVNGYITTVTFAPDEEVQNFGSGFSTAWEFSATGNHFFLKPRGRDGTTNVIVVTDKRTYSLDIHLTSDPAKATYQLTFRYPQDLRRSQKAQRERSELEQALARPDPNLEKLDEYVSGANYAYSWSYGKTESSWRLRPERVFDDGRFTYFLLPQLTDLPALYAKTSQGESLVQTHLEKGVVVVHGVYAEYRLRAGQDVIGVYNEAYSWQESGK